MQANTYKVIIIKGSTSEFETLLNKGWALASAMPHTAGALVVLVKSNA